VHRQIDVTIDGHDPDVSQPVSNPAVGDGQNPLAKEVGLDADLKVPIV
jgi:hypothetical protein